MKIQELMLDNWVHVDGRIQQVTGLSMLGGSFVETFPPFASASQIHKIDEINPILITEEILEKNGFKKDDKGYWAIKWRQQGIGGQTCSNTDEKYIIFEKGWLFINIPEGRIETAASYVHQLQNILRLYEINKEITLL